MFCRLMGDRSYNDISCAMCQTCVMARAGGVSGSRHRQPGCPELSRPARARGRVTIATPRPRGRSGAVPREMPTAKRVARVACGGGEIIANNGTPSNGTAQSWSINWCVQGSHPMITPPQQLGIACCGLEYLVYGL